jgi:hypothetical protein
MNNQQLQKPMSNTPFKSIVYAAIVCVGVLGTSCQKEEPKVNKPTPEASTDPLLQSLLDLGYKKEHIEEKGKYFLVDGDLFIAKESLKDLETADNNPGGRKGQYIGANRGILGYVQRAAISIRIDATASQWNNDIVAAVRFWNTLDESRINLYITDRTTGDIVIRGVAAPGQTVGFPNPNAAGASQLPLNGNPANWVDLNTNPNILTNVIRRNVIVHELGHAVGFQHSDRVGLTDAAQQVTGTPSSDANSIFNSGGAANQRNPTNNLDGWMGFSYWDRVAIQTLYPEDYTGDRVYNGDFYSYGYPDVVNAYQGNPTAIREHFGHTGGPVEGRVGSPLFEVDFYRTTHADLRGLTRTQAITHWLNTGGNEGRASSSIFDVQFYLANNPDIAAAYGTQGFQKAYYHWVTTGIREGRAASPNFNVRTYLQRNPDVQAAFGTDFRTATFHWFFYGKPGGRQGI